jgi:hypothetical protein
MRSDEMPIPGDVTAGGGGDMASLTPVFFTTPFPIFNGIVFPDITDKL